MLAPLVKNPNQGGSKYFLLGLVKIFSGPNDIILVLDGDDSLHRKDALEIVNQKYLDSGALFTYGSYMYEGRWEEQIVDLPPEIRDGKMKFKPREQTWLYGHPRTFKAHLLDHISKRDFQHSDGSWLIKCTERGFVYRMLELAGPSRIGYIPEKIYKYRYSYKSSTLALISPQDRSAMLNHTIFGMKQSHEYLMDINVILLTWKRIHLLASQLKWIQEQVDLGVRRIHVHIVNNNVMESNQIERAVHKFKEWQLHWLSSRSQMSVTLPMKVSVTNNPMERLNHNFARFVYVNDLRRIKPLDEVIFLDDDQYWPPTFFSTLLKAHKPKSISTWYGKTFGKQAASCEDGLPSYWKPDAGLTDLITGNAKGESFKYGGTGGSIFDSNLWLLDSQLLRLEREGDLPQWARIDDLWASYVLGALLGWEINRISNDVLPIDIGDFLKLKTRFKLHRSKINKQLLMSF